MDEKINAAKEVSFMIRSGFLFFLLLILSLVVPTDFKITHSLDPITCYPIKLDVKSKLNIDAELSNKSYESLTIEHKNRGY